MADSALARREPDADAPTPTAPRAAAARVLADLDQATGDLASLRREAARLHAQLEARTSAVDRSAGEARALRRALDEAHAAALAAQAVLEARLELARWVIARRGAATAASITPT